MKKKASGEEISSEISFSSFPSYPSIYEHQHRNSAQSYLNHPTIIQESSIRERTPNPLSLFPLETEKIKTNFVSSAISTNGAYIPFTIETPTHLWILWYSSPYNQLEFTVFFIIFILIYFRYQVILLL